MKKVILISTLALLAVLLAVGYSLLRPAYDNHKTSMVSLPNSSKKTTDTIETATIIDIDNVNEKLSDSAEYEDDSAATIWRDSYRAFLKDFPVLSNCDVSGFSLRDLDNNGIPELITVQSDSNSMQGILIIYSCDDIIYKVGEYTNPKLGVAGLRVSSNQAFPGLFTCWWGGGMEHYGYLTIQDEKLIHEDLWYDDHHVEDSPGLVQISGDKQLIKESMDAHPPYDYTENLLEMYPVNEDNIIEIIK